jgi:multidrug efflux system outer membrane protein
MKTHASILVLIPVVCALDVGGCAVGPDFGRPPADLDARIPELDSTISSGTSIKIVEAPPWERWWQVFRDPQLDDLVGEARLANYDIRAAVARIHAARAVVRQQFAPLLPQMGATGQYVYQRFAPNAILVQPTTGSASAPGGPSGSGATTFAFTGQPFQLWAGTGDLSYELDLWGRIRRALEAAEADEAATEEDKKNVEITTEAAVANAYFDLGQAEADLAINHDAVTTRERALALVKGRYDAGLAPELDLRRAQAELANARAQVPEAERRHALAEHQLAILTGRQPTLHFDGRPPAAFSVPPEVPVGLPGTLLERRPDVRAAEMRVRAQNARIGVAIANFFPQVTITGRAGYASLDPSTLIAPNSQIWAIGPTIRLPFFQGGQTYAQMLEAEANTDVATADFYRIMLNAFREVADAIVSLWAHERVRDQQRAYVVAEERALELATIEYDQGLVNYLSVLDAQRELLSAQQALILAQRNLLSDIVQLQKALGGGWADVPADNWTPTKAGTSFGE